MKNLIGCMNIDKSTRNELIQIAFLHDIGYSERLLNTGFHPLDGALFCQKHKFSIEIAAAVMFHTEAFYTVQQNFPDLLNIYLENKFKLNIKSKNFIDLITYCDLHRSSIGKKVTLEERLNEIALRYGNSHNIYLTMNNRKNEFQKTIERVEKQKKK